MSTPAPFVAPAVILVYGKGKIGKTSDAGFSFPRGLFVAREDQVKSIASMCGYKPKLAPPVRILRDVVGLIEQLGRSKHRDQFDSIVVDDASLLAEATIREYESHNRNGYGAWGKLRDDVLDLREAARGCGLHVAYNFHERQPENKDGKFFRGGPALPSRNLTDSLPVMADTVLRASIEPGRTPWAGIYVCDPTDPTYVSGDRHGVAPKVGPMNMGELLRAGGYKLRRLPGFEWQDDAAEQIAGKLMDGATRGELVTAFRAKMQKLNIPDAHALWALRDGFDRMDFRWHKAKGRWGAFTEGGGF